MHISTDPPAGGAGKTVGHKNAWKLDAQSSLTVPISQLSRFTLNMKVRLREVSPCERRERKHKLLPVLCESRTCWNVDTYVTRVFIMNFAVRQIPKQRPLTADPQRCSPLHCALVSQSLSLTDFSLLLLSLSSYSLPLYHSGLSVSMTLKSLLWHWNDLMENDLDISTSLSTPPRTPPHSLPQAQRAV